MVVNRRKKVGKYRGHSNHGGGMRKKRRGAGSRGGRGRAGTGKRAGQKKAGMEPQLGSRGFRPRRLVKVVRCVNVGFFNAQILDKMVSSGAAVKRGEGWELDLGKAGYDKLLGGGSTAFKVKVKVKEASQRAIEKIKGAGGEVEVPV